MTAARPGLDTSRTVDVFVGLDFGTCWTKAVVRTAYEKVPPRLVQLSTAPGEGEWLIPTSCRLEGEQIVLCEPEASGAIQHLKVALMRAAKPGSVSRGVDEAVALAAGYLALVLMRVRVWMNSDYEKFLPGRPKRVSLRLGIPSAGYDHAEMSRLFLAAGRAAYMASLIGEPRDERDITLVEMRRLVGEALADAGAWGDVDAGEWAGAVEVVPEVAAEALGYARDLHSYSGLHLMVDVGASTLDICGFILGKNRQGSERRTEDREGDLYALLTAVVHDDLGVGGFVRARSMQAAAGRAHDTSPYSNEACENAETFASRTGRTVSSIQAIDAAFEARCRLAIGEVVKALTTVRDPNAPEWREGVRVFLCGGGSHAEPFRLAINKLARDLERATRRRLELVELPVPPVARDQRMSQYMARRIAVAYGLSHETFEIGEIVRPSQIGDIGRKIVRVVEGAHIPYDRI